MTSPKKIESNRRNSHKSTGPKTPRGKQASRFNALRLGVFASSRLLPGENTADYNRATFDLLQDCRPTGAVQKIFADQIVGAFWRLRRIERAEQTYFREVKLGQMFQFIRTLSDDELTRLKSAHLHRRRGNGSAATTDVSSQPEPIGTSHHDNSDIRAELRKLDMLRRLANWDCTILEGLVPRQESRPKACLDQQRRAVTRELVHALSSLRELQRFGGFR